MRKPSAGEHGSRAYWICQLGGWSFYAVTTTLQLRQMPGIAPGQAVFETLFAALLGLLLTHRFRRYLLAQSWLSLPARALAPRAVLASLVLAALFLAPLQFLEVFVYGSATRAPWLVFLGGMIRWSMIFFIWVAIYLGFGLLQQSQRERARQTQLMQALQASELRALKSQLNPHFLFNALNSVRALIGDEPELARTSITQLSRMLRYALAAGEEDLVQFARELEITDDYLALESLRLAERLIIKKEIASSAAAAKIPVMLLQTLVENAVKHGVAQLPEGGTLRIAAAVADGVLAIELENPRPSGARASSEPRSTGIGIANATERLRLLFGPAATLELDLAQAGRAIARVRIPQTP